MLKKIRYFPVTLLSVALGMLGFTLSLHKLEQTFSWQLHLSPYVLYFSIFLAISITGLYTLKIILYPNECKKDLAHPVRINFFPLFSIILLLMSILFLGKNLFISQVLWIIGATIHLYFTLFIVSKWMHHEFDIVHINPSWFIPAVGNILVPIAGVHHANPEISWFFFSIGIVFWVVLFTIVFYRIIFHHPIMQKLLPTFFIMIAPPAIGMISYTTLTNSNIDTFAHILYYFSFFIVALLFFQIRYFYSIPFYLSWWAYSFPIAAFISSTLVMYQKTQIHIFAYIALALFTFLTILVGLLIWKTLKQKICVQEE